MLAILTSFHRKLYYLALLYIYIINKSISMVDRNKTSLVELEFNIVIGTRRAKDIPEKNDVLLTLIVVIFHYNRVDVWQ